MLRPDLRDETYAALRDHVLPSREQLRWREVPWHRSLWEAVLDDASRETPILLWAMDGNPLGMTCRNGIRGRERVWSDRGVRALTERFVPAADDAGRLTRDAGPDCDLFRTVAEQGHFGGCSIPTTTRQGIYAITAGGMLLASENVLDPRAVERMLDAALERWGALSDEERRRESARHPSRASADGSLSGEQDAAHPPTHQGLVLRVYARDLPAGDAPTEEWNQDHLWLTVSEAHALVPEGPVGARSVVPEDFVRRIACLHLVDDVRGQSIAFSAAAVERAVLGSEIIAIDGSTVTLRLSGHVRASETGIWPVHGAEDVARPVQQRRGYDMDLLGRAVFERDAGQFRELEFLAAGLRWGATQYNGRGHDRAPAPLGIFFTLCEDDRYVPAALRE